MIAPPPRRVGLKYERERSTERIALESRRRQRRADDEHRRAVKRRRGAVLLALIVVPAVAVWALAFRSPDQPSDSAKRPAEDAVSGDTRGAVAPVDVRTPATVRGILVSADVAADRARMRGILADADLREGLNTIVVDVKDERGRIAFPVDVPLAREAEAIRRRYDPARLVAQAHAEGVYVIGRVVAFEDPLAVSARPALAVKKGGRTWRSAAGSSWLDPTRRDARRYVLDVARAAAEAGFDEIMLDGVRFPAERDAGLAYRQRGVDRDRLIADFLTEAVSALRPRGVKVSATVFGLAATRDLGVGQDPARLKLVVDALSPTVFPAAFASGEFGIGLPGANPHDTALASLADWRARLVNGRAALRPWLQAFPLNGTTYGTGSIDAQIKAAGEAATDGYLLWTPVAGDDGVLTGR